MKLKQLVRPAGLVVFGLGLVFLVIVLSVQQVRMASLSRQVSERTESLISEIRGSGESSAEVKRNVLVLAGEVSEILKALRLPESAVRFETGENVVTDGGENVAIFLRGVDTLVAEWREERRGRIFLELGSFLRRNLPISEYSIVERDGQGLSIEIGGSAGFSLALDDSSDDIIVLSVDGEGKNFTEAGKDLISFLVSKTPDVKAVFEARAIMETSLVDIFDGSEVQAYLKENDLSLSDSKRELRQVQVVSYSVVRKGRALLSVFPDPVKGVFVVGETEVPGSDSVFLAAKEQIAGMDIRSPEEVRIEELLVSMREITGDSGFSDFLATRGLRLVDGGREDSDYYYFDLYGEDERRIGAFGVQKFIGDVYLVDHQDVPIGSLKALEASTVKKN